MLRPLTKNFSGLQSLDKQFDDGFFNSFSGFIRYSLDWFDDGFFDSFDNLANFVNSVVDYSSFSGSYFSSTSGSYCKRSVFFQFFQYGSVFDDSFFKLDNLVSFFGNFFCF